MCAVRKPWSGLINLVFPDDCRVCEKPLTNAARYPVCIDCLNGLAPLQADYWCRACQTPFATPYPLNEDGLCGLCRRGMRGFDRAISFGYYEGTLRKLIHVFKYGGVPTLARPLAGCLMTALPVVSGIDAIVPVPMHWWRRYRRGYNQAFLLASEISQRTGMPLENAVRRVKHTAPQAGLSDYQRRHALGGVFSVTKPGSIRNRHVLLIDDVFTTGATVSACGAALKRAGAAGVTVLTLARVDRRIAVPESRSAVKSNAAGG